MSTSAPRLRTVFKSYPYTAKLLSGEITDQRVQLEFTKVEPIFRAFAPMARDQVYDVSEMAIVTYLQAKAYEKPLLLLPFVVAARLQQKCLVYSRKKRASIAVSDLVGAKVGVRAYTQTTGMWVRAILHGTYGIATDQIKWVTFEEGHLAEYHDPPFVTRSPGGNLLDLFRAGEVDAAIFGNDLPTDDDVAPVIPNPAAADRAWFDAHRFVPINHVVVMKRSVAEAQPDTVAAMFDLLKRSKAAAGVATGDTPDALPDGIEAMRRPLQMILDACDEQRLLPRTLTVDECFADCLSFLGEAAR